MTGRIHLFNMNLVIIELRAFRVQISVQGTGPAVSIRLYIDNVFPQGIRPPE